MPPSLASLEDFAARIAGGIDAANEARAQKALDDASALIRDEGKEWSMESGVDDDDPPDVVVTICAQVAKRSFLNPEGVRSEAIDGFSTGFNSPDVYLTKEEKRRVRRAAGRLPVGAVDLTVDIPLLTSEKSRLTSVDEESL